MTSITIWSLILHAFKAADYNNCQLFTWGHIYPLRVERVAEPQERRRELRIVTQTRFPDCWLTLNIDVLLLRRQITEYRDPLRQRCMTFILKALWRFCTVNDCVTFLLVREKRVIKNHRAVSTAYLTFGQTEMDKTIFLDYSQICFHESVCNPWHLQVLVALWIRLEHPQGGCSSALHAWRLDWSGGKGTQSFSDWWSPLGCPHPDVLRSPHCVQMHYCPPLSVHTFHLTTLSFPISYSGLHLMPSAFLSLFYTTAPTTGTQDFLHQI